MCDLPYVIENTLGALTITVSICLLIPCDTAVTSSETESALSQSDLEMSGVTPRSISVLL